MPTSNHGIVVSYVKDVTKSTAFWTGAYHAMTSPTVRKYTMHPCAGCMAHPSELPGRLSTLVSSDDVVVRQLPLVDANDAMSLMESDNGTDTWHGMVSPFMGLSAFCNDGELWNVVIETPKGSRNKFDYDPELGLFRLGGVLPLGAVFPFDFGFVPSTLGGDGDPLDVLTLMDEPAFTGCLVTVRLLGVIEAEQSEGGETTRNDGGEFTQPS